MCNKQLTLLEMESPFSWNNMIASDNWMGRGAKTAKGLLAAFNLSANSCKASENM